MATDIPRIHKWWQQPAPNNDYIMSNFMPFVPSDLSANAQPPENAVNEQTDRWTDRQTNNNIHKHPWMLSVSHLDTSACQIVGHFFQALCMQYTNQAHGWLDGRTNAWNDNNTHRHQCWPRVSHLETSAFLTLCHSFPVTCQQMCKNLKMWLTDLLTDKRTDRRTDKRVAGGYYCWGVLLWPPELGLGRKCDKKWKFKNVEKITSFSDAVTLTFDLRPWKVNQVRTLSLPMCIPNLRTIHPVVFELSR